MKKRLKRFWFVILLLFICFLYIQSLYNEHKNQSNSISTKTIEATGLNPLVKEKTNQLIQQAAKIGITVIITDDFRSSKDQDQLYEKGRTVSGNIVTNAKGGESYHNYGLAVDFALKTPTGDVIWDMEYDGNKNGRSDWYEVVDLAKALGFSWGGDWAQFKDYPHLQMDFGLSINDLQNGEKPDET
ncbi:M15 family metallopeptidase [Heyndrickxia oleronia]|uniref:M15 family metallopeptidase n=1 Tax=Heyndrickxia oleronia TaxID=38875 RepID=UPI000990FF06|nr:M15 family metallopeptidase [Heyndrickxia oleronia]MCI1591490.1 M15 family metallopeptidase [Heyndrickxia oleronia]MCI1614374.1 M15 family metallopeptidase [Heyndrickxia oleronia]MCI1745448.1 M15 family metallopeptidase [Heyndrickxia oleronia]MCI1762255.1 M15 family metallopeptidase [Heyndrickxia oleronia]MCM3455249.1 M15 family metallopeptidase [Heyndrickxia oleronia]